MTKFREILIKLNDWKFIILIILIIGGTFYWFQIRPSIVKKNCFTTVRNGLKENIEGANIESYNFIYNLCLHSKGL